MLFTLFVKKTHIGTVGTEAHISIATVRVSRTGIPKVKT